MKVINIKSYKRKTLLGMILQHLVGAHEKARAIIKPRERVVLIYILHLANQIKLTAHNDIFETQKQNVRVIRLRYKVSCTQIKCLLLCGFIVSRCNRNDRKRGKGALLFMLQKGISVHDGHKNIQ